MGLESTKINFVFGQGSVMNLSRGAYDTTVDPQLTREGILSSPFQPTDAFGVSVHGPCNPSDATGGENDPKLSSDKHAIVTLVQAGCSS